MYKQARSKEIPPKKVCGDDRLINNLSYLSIHDNNNSIHDNNNASTDTEALPQATEVNEDNDSSIKDCCYIKDWVKVPIENVDNPNVATI